jgi:hypothetical protein
VRHVVRTVPFRGEAAARAHLTKRSTICPRKELFGFCRCCRRPIDTVWLLCYVDAVHFLELLVTSKAGLKKTSLG